MQDRWTEIRAIWQNNQMLYVIAGFLAGILFFPAVEALSTDARELLSGFVPEAVGIAFTVLLIDRLYQQREYKREIRKLKSDLVRRANSKVNDIAIQAVEEIQNRGWIMDDKGILARTWFFRANLRNADFDFANLRGTMFFETNLKRTKFIDADLREAELIRSDLRGANLQNANLEGAVLFDCFLENADLETAKFNDETVLPDETNWSVKIDLTRFTDPNHPNFYEPDWVKEQRAASRSK